MSDLTPGVLDGAARTRFLYGACAALALAVHARTGWPIVAVTDAHNVHDGRAGGGSAMHYCVRHPSGRLLDVEGLHEDEDVIERYRYDADDEEAALGVTTVADVEEWYVEAQGEPVPVVLAATFVEPLLKAIEDPTPAP